MRTIPAQLVLLTVFFSMGCAMTSAKDKSFDAEKLLVSADFPYSRSCTLPL